MTKIQRAPGIFKTHVMCKPLSGQAVKRSEIITRWAKRAARRITRSSLGTFALLEQTSGVHDVNNNPGGYFYSTTFGCAVFIFQERLVSM